MLTLGSFEVLTGFLQSMGPAPSPPATTWDPWLGRPGHYTWEGSTQRSARDHGNTAGPQGEEQQGLAGSQGPQSGAR